MKPKFNIPTRISEALSILKKLDITYIFDQNNNLWEINYKDFLIIIPNWVNENKIGLIFPLLIKGEDEELNKMVYDFALLLLEEDMKDLDIQYLGGGLCQIMQLWNFSIKSKLHKYQVLEILNDLLYWGNKVDFIMESAYEMLFNPPSEVWAEILRDIENKS